MDLHGKTILITRAASQSGALSNGLAALGARVLECPAIAVVPVEDWTEVDRAAAKLNTYDWLIFTSTNAVEFFLPRVRAAGVTCSIPIAVIGAATARKLQTWQLQASRIPASFRAESLLDEFPADLTGVRILIPRAEKARELLPDELRRRGAAVDVITVYRTVKAESNLKDLPAILQNEKIDAAAFLSPSAVQHFTEELGADLHRLLEAVPIAAIGPVAREAVEAAGLRVSIQPDRATVENLIEAIRDYFAGSPASG